MPPPANGSDVPSGWPFVAANGSASSPTSPSSTLCPPKPTGLRQMQRSQRDGTTIQVPLDKLSQEDQEWIKNRKR